LRECLDDLDRLEYFLSRAYGWRINVDHVTSAAVALGGVGAGATGTGAGATVASGPIVYVTAGLLIGLSGVAGAVIVAAGLKVAYVYWGGTLASSERSAKSNAFLMIAGLPSEQSSLRIERRTDTQMSCPGPPPTTTKYDQPPAKKYDYSA
jgi:hypothetical protein